MSPSPCLHCEDPLDASPHHHHHHHHRHHHYRRHHHHHHRHRRRHSQSHDRTDLHAQQRSHLRHSHPQPSPSPHSDAASLRSDAPSLRSGVTSFRSDAPSFRSEILSGRSDAMSLRSDALSLRSDAMSLRSDTPVSPSTPSTPSTPSSLLRAGAARADAAYRVRKSAAQLARSRAHPIHYANPDETRHRHPARSRHAGHFSYLASFTKGLPHDPDTGLVHDPAAYALFLHAVASPTSANLRRIPLGPPDPPTWYSAIARHPPARLRAWESLGAGLTFDLQGPDAQAVTMPPAPELRSAELAAEMTELYWMALLRDVPMSQLSKAGRRHAEHCVRGSRRRREQAERERALVDEAVGMLNATSWACASSRTLTEAEKRRRRKAVDVQTVFRGITPGDRVGPYVSQFLLVGTTGLGAAHEIRDGHVQYGAMRMDQRVRVAEEGRDFMTTWAAFLDVQNGADLRGRDVWRADRKFRFIATPRDLATYVHHDALYQAYLNACLILLDLKAPFDEGVPFQAADEEDKQQGFATFGGPHILTLVTEVATRALKAVRFQKYNTHRRLRPEAVGGLIDRYSGDPGNGVYDGVAPLFKALDGQLLGRVGEANAEQNARLSDGEVARVQDLKIERNKGASLLLPMAFPEGSPMHPSYGAGHATVGGACVTVLKAFFDHTFELPFAYVASDDGRTLEKAPHLEGGLTVEGELNKLCSNISIGRSWAGVHYFSDYLESILLGEQVALGILEEQKLTYSETFSMTIPLFGGGVRVI